MNELKQCKTCLYYSVKLNEEPCYTCKINYTDYGFKHIKVTQ